MVIKDLKVRIEPRKLFKNMLESNLTLDLVITKEQACNDKIEERDFS